MIPIKDNYEIFFFSIQAQSSSEVEYTNCTSAEWPNLFPTRVLGMTLLQMLRLP